MSPDQLLLSSCTTIRPRSREPEPRDPMANLLITWCVSIGPSWSAPRCHLLSEMGGRERQGFPAGASAHPSAHVLPNGVLRSRLRLSCKTDQGPEALERAADLKASPTAFPVYPLPGLVVPTHTAMAELIWVLPCQRAALLREEAGAAGRSAHGGPVLTRRACTQPSPDGTWASPGTALGTLTCCP